MAPTESVRKAARLDGRVALITGSGAGMGRAHAILMAERGAGIVVQDINGKGAEETAEQVRKRGARVEVIVRDVTDIAQMQRDIRAAETRMGSIDILVNNAGIDDNRPIEGYDEATFQRVFDVHVKGSFFAAQAVVPGMKARKRGKIINISSIWGMTAHSSDSVYCGAKAALLGLTKAWAKELAPWNIHVNAICPGGVVTAMAMDGEGMAAIARKAQDVPLKRYAEPVEIAYAVAFLASGEADFITGQALSPNGGQVIVGI
ncbi:MAG: SDR family NAD(P)-dependent oxidoreductase [Alphaproteobacteria bacterium]